MNYTIITLCALGLLGILIHNLMKLDSINRNNNGNLNFRKYIALERFSIMISICVVIVALIVRSEIKELEIAGKYLGFSFITLGYMAQSIVARYSSKAEKFIKENTGE